VWWEADRLGHLGHLANNSVLAALRLVISWSLTVKRRDAEWGRSEVFLVFPLEGR
jgi:hypothetical protein